MKLSFTCIGHNEVHHLRELLPSLLQWGDEVIYVDCDSGDHSHRVAESLGCRVFQKPNNKNLNVNKSYAMEQALGDWIFYVDPDERLNEDLMGEIKERIQHPGPVVAFRLPRRNHFFGHCLRYGGQYPDYQLRLFMKGQAHFPKKHIHESLKVDGSMGTLKTPMDHYPYLNISQFLRKMDFYSDFEAHHLYEAGVKVSVPNTIRYFLLKPKSRILRRWILKGGFRDGFPGFFAALFDGIGWMLRYFKLWELYEKEKKQG